MENTTSEKKELFDAEHGFTSMQNLPPIVRWILVLPVAVLSFIIVNGLTNWALKISTAEWFVYVASFLFHASASALFVYYGAATAPKGRKVTMVILPYF